MDRSGVDERRAGERGAGRRRLRQRLVCCVVLVAATLGAGLALQRSQADARKGIVQRWDARTELAAQFVETYVDQLFSREDEVARVSFVSSSDGIAATSHAFGFSNAVLLDGSGAVLAVYPDKPDLLGTRIASSYPHLARALAGSRAVSPVVAAAADGQPVIGFALPFTSLSGRRVFSGAYGVESTPLGAYLQRMTPVRSAGIYLVDEVGTIVSAAQRVQGVRTLREVDPALARAADLHLSGYFNEGTSEQYFTSYPVQGTPWRLIARAPSSALFVPVAGANHYLPWLLLGVLAMVGALAQWLWFRRLDVHDDLRVAYRRLDRLASLDGLTELLNRRATREHLDAEAARGRAQGEWLSVLMVDVDHFKRINDTFGHAGGDAALVAVAGRLRDALREQDVLGRWGGEEFLAVLSGTDGEVAAVVAERLRHAVAAYPVMVGTGGDAISVSVSVGVASSTDASPDVLVHAADRALYAAKDGGRDRVRSLLP